MEKELLNYNLLDELEKMYYSSLYTSDIDIKSFIKNLLIDIKNILNNYETIKDEEFIRILNRFVRVTTDEEMCEKTICDFWSPIGGYEYHTELYYDDIVNNENVITENEMIDLYNRVNNTNYKYLTSLKTKMIYNHYYSSGYGKDKDEGLTYKLTLQLGVYRIRVAHVPVIKLNFTSYLRVDQKIVNTKQVSTNVSEDKIHPAVWVTHDLKLTHPPTFTYESNKIGGKEWENGNISLISVEQISANLETPIISWDGGSWDSRTVELKHKDPSAEIYYTLDGSQPDKNSH